MDIKKCDHCGDVMEPKETVVLIVKPLAQMQAEHYGMLIRPDVTLPLKSKAWEWCTVCALAFVVAADHAQKKVKDGVPAGLFIEA